MYIKYPIIDLLKNSNCKTVDKLFTKRNNNT